MRTSHNRIASTTPNSATQTAAQRAKLDRFYKSACSIGNPRWKCSATASDYRPIGMRLIGK